MGLGVLLGVRVQVGMEVREAVGVKDNMAINVPLRSVQMAKAVCVPAYTGVRDGVNEIVAVSWAVCVREGMDLVTVPLGSGISVCSAVGDAVSVWVDELLSTAVRERI